MTTVWDRTQKPRITGIGSLPHSNIDSALEFSMRVGVPYLPQIPIRNPWEYMIPQALDGLPGLQLEPGGLVSLPMDLWKSQSHVLEKRLDRAFASQIFDEFEPLGSNASGWQPFLWELEENGHSVAKIQIAGPFTAQWAIRCKGEALPISFPELSTQVYRLVIARALSMVSRLNSAEIHPIFFIDEPGLYAYSNQNPMHIAALSELKMMVQTLQKSGATVGIHCCGNTDWSAVADLGVDLLSLDTSISLPSALSVTHRPAVEKWITQGGRFSFGVIPTNISPGGHLATPELIAKNFLQILNSSWTGSSNYMNPLLKESFFTPACGLALQSIADAERILENLVGLYETIDSY